MWNQQNQRTAKSKIPGREGGIFRTDILMSIHTYYIVQVFMLLNSTFQVLLLKISIFDHN